MPDATQTGLCRLTVQASGRQFELAVPSDVPLGDLLPSIVDHVGPHGYEQALIHQGFVLQRLGVEPFDEDRTVAALGLRDGELVYLRARSDQLPPVHFDDLGDGIAGVLRARSDTWVPAFTHRALVAAAGATLTAGLVLLGIGLPPVPRVIACAALTVLLLVAAGAASRAMDDLPVAATLGVAACAAALLGAGSTPHGGTGVELLAARAFGGGCAAAAVSLLALAAVGAAAELFASVAVGMLLPALAALLPMLHGGPIDIAAAALIPLLVLLMLLAPMLALRVAGLRVPQLPANAEQLQDDIDPYSGSAVLAGAGLVNRYVAGLQAVVGGCAALSVIVLLGRPDVSGYLAAAVLSILLLLHARQVGGLWQRLALVVPGGGGALLTGMCAARLLPTTWLLPVVTGLVLVAAGLLVCAWTVPTRRLVPYWGRAAELLHTLFALALLPLLVAHLGVFGWARGLFD